MVIFYCVQFNAVKMTETQARPHSLSLSGIGSHCSQLVGRSSIRLNYFRKNLNSATKLEHVAVGTWELFGQTWLPARFLFWIQSCCSSWEYLRLKMQRYVAMSFIHYILATLKLFTTLILPTDRMRKRTQRRPISLARKPKRGVTRGISPLLTITDSGHTLLSE